MRCDLCKRKAKYRIDGWVEDGRDGCYAYNNICKKHKKEFEKWGSLAKSDGYLHGYAYYESITKLVKE